MASYASDNAVWEILRAVGGQEQFLEDRRKGAVDLLRHVSLAFRKADEATRKRLGWQVRFEETPSELHVAPEADLDKTVVVKVDRQGYVYVTDHRGSRQVHPRLVFLPPNSQWEGEDIDIGYEVEHGRRPHRNAVDVVVETVIEFLQPLRTSTGVNGVVPPVTKPGDEVRA